MEIDLSKLEGVQFKSGAHSSPKEGMCVMEAVAYVRGLPFSDHPACVSPVLAAFLRGWNDRLPDDATRTRLLKPLIPRVIGTAGDGKEARRREILVDFAREVALFAGLGAHDPARGTYTPADRAEAAEWVRQRTVQAVLEVAEAKPEDAP